MTHVRFPFVFLYLGHAGERGSEMPDHDKIDSILEVFSKIYIWTYILLTCAYIENGPSRLSRRFDKPGGCIQF